MIEGLTLRQVRFANRIAEDEINNAEGDGESGTSIAVSCGYSRASAAEMASRNLRNPLVLKAIQDRRDELAVAAGLTPERVLREIMTIAFADPGQLMRVVVRCCANCWPLGDKGLPPNPECKNCRGDGERFVWIADTSALPPAARKLFAGAKQTKDGIEVKLRDQDWALKFLAEYLGLGKKLEVSGPNGGPIPIAAAATVRDLTDDQLDALIAANLGVGEGVSIPMLTDGQTIDGTYA